MTFDYDAWLRTQEARKRQRGLDFFEEVRKHLSPEARQSFDAATGQKPEAPTHKIVACRGCGQKNRIPSVLPEGKGRPVCGKCKGPLS